MASVLALALVLAQQPQTVTFEHPCANSAVVLEALGEEVGLQLKPNGSVEDDYFLVRFDDVPVEEALEKIAATLNATWTESAGVHYLTRTTAQEAAGPKELRARLEKGIAAYIANDALKITDWGRERSRDLLVAYVNSDGTLDRGRARTATNAKGPCREMLDEFIRAVGAKKLAALPEGKHVTFRWSPRTGEQAIPAGLRTKANAFARNVNTIGEAARGLGLFMGGDFDLPGEMRLASSSELVTPDWIAFQVSVRWDSVHLIMMPNGTNPSPYASVSITGKRDSGPAPKIPEIEGDYSPSPLARVMSDRMRAINSNTAHRLETANVEGQAILTWFDSGLKPDFTHLFLGEAILQCVTAADLNAVVSVSDGSYHGLFVSQWADSQLQDVFSQLVTTTDCSLDQDGRWFLGYPSIIPMWSDRIDRDTTARFALDVFHEGWPRIDTVARLSANCKNNVTYQWSRRLAALLQPIPYNHTWMVSDSSLLSLKLYDSLPTAAKRSAREGWLSMPVIDLPASVRSRLVGALEGGGFGVVREWNAEPSWGGPATGSFAGDPARGSSDLDGAMFEVRVEQRELLTTPDVREGSHAYSSPAMSVEAAAEAYIEMRSGENTRLDYGTLAPYTAERVTMRLRLADGTMLRFVVTTDSRNSETRFYPVAQLPGDIGEKLRAEIKRLGG